MPGLNALDVAIGLIFMFLTLSLVVTAAQEMVASLFKSRGRMLWKGIKNLVDDDQIARDLYSHPLVRSLASKRGLPSYIPSRTFTLALLDTLQPGSLQNQSLLQQRLASPNTPLNRALAILLSESSNDFEQFKRNVEVWFNHSMERVSGWYKRQAQWIALLLAVVVTVAVNADSAHVASTLWRDPAIRASLVSAAERAIQHPEDYRVQGFEPIDSSGPAPPPCRQPEEENVDMVEQQFTKRIAAIKELGLPLGWEKEWLPNSEGQKPKLSAVFGSHWLGWLLTAFAVSLGAPFWFDTLNRFMAIRSAGKAPEEKPRRPKVVQQPINPGEKPIATEPPKSSGTTPEGRA